MPMPDAVHPPKMIAEREWTDNLKPTTVEQEIFTSTIFAF